MFLYTLFNGQSSLTDCISAVVGAIMSVLPGANYKDLYAVVKRALTTLLNSLDGNVSWSDMGSLIWDLAAQIAQFFPIWKVGKIVDALWTVGSTL